MRELRRRTPRSMSARKVLGSFVAAALTLSLAACGSNDSGGGKSGDYVIGVTDDLSGPVSSYGQNVRKTWNAYVDGVNKAGGVNGHQIKLVFLDDKSDAATVSANVRSLIAQNAILITASTLSSNCTIAKKLAIQQKVPLSCWAANPDDIAPPNPYVYERFPTEAALAQPMIDLAASKVTGSSKRMAIAAGTSEGAQIWAKNTAALAKKAGWDVVDQSSVDLSQGADVGALANKVAAAKPDAVLFEITQPASNQFVQQLRTLGTKAIAVSLFEDVPGMLQLKDPNFYQISATSYVPSKPTDDAAKTYVQQLAAQGISAGNLNQINVGLNYAGIAQIVASLKACGDSCSRSSLAAAMSKTVVTLPGVTLAAGFGYTSESHVPVKAVQAYAYDPSTQQPAPVGQPLTLGSFAD